MEVLSGHRYPTKRPQNLLALSELCLQVLEKNSSGAASPKTGLDFCSWISHAGSCSDTTMGFSKCSSRSLLKFDHRKFQNHQVQHQVSAFFRLVYFLRFLLRQSCQTPHFGVWRYHYDIELICNRALRNKDSCLHEPLQSLVVVGEQPCYLDHHTVTLASIRVHVWILVWPLVKFCDIIFLWISLCL